MRARPRKLPVVLNADEVVRFLEAVPGLKTRAALTTAYAAGLRAFETVGLKVGDIDSVRMVIRVEHGKSLPLRRRGAGSSTTLAPQRGPGTGNGNWCQAQRRLHPAAD